MARRLVTNLDGRELELSNLDKVLYPEAGFTKAEVIDYYLQVAPVLLGHLRGRPLTRVRFPNGVDTPGFFEKNAPAGTPDWVRRVRLPVPGSASGRETLDFITVDGVATLVWLANLAAIELHTPQWRIKDGRPDDPDLLVIDLDPGPPAGLSECCLVAVAARHRLELAGLTPLAKTSGRKGMQLLCRLAPGTSAQASTRLASEVALDLERALPELVTARMTKSLRPGKVFIDWSQNAAAKTTIAPYSLRATPQPAVSMPWPWSEVAAGSVRPVGPAEALQRLAASGDLMAQLTEPA